MSMSSLLSVEANKTHGATPVTPKEPAPTSWSHEALFPEDRLQQQHRPQPHKEGAPTSPSQQRLQEPRITSGPSAGASSSAYPAQQPQRPASTQSISAPDQLPKTAPFEFSRTSYGANKPPTSQPRVTTGSSAKTSPQMQNAPTLPSAIGSSRHRAQMPSYEWRQPPGANAANMHPIVGRPQQAQGQAQAQARPGYFVSDPQRESEVPGAPQNGQAPSAGASSGHYHHHHHRHSMSNTGNAKSPVQPQPGRMEGQLPSISGWAPPVAPSHPSSALHGPPSLHGPEATAAGDLKRKRSNLDDGHQPHRHHHRVIHVGHELEHPSFAPTPYNMAGMQAKRTEPPIVRKAELPIFRDQDILSNVGNPFPSAHTKSLEEILKRPEVEAGRSAYLGSFVWDPRQDTSKLLDGNILRRHIGARLDVLADTRWLGGIPFSLSSEPKVIWQIAKDDGVEWDLWDLEPFAKRKIWGSMVYTDDSDPLLAAVHTGALQLYPTSIVPTKTSSEKPLRLKMSLRVLPKLINYQGTPRSGVDSRSWGNSHDGVSLYVEKVELVEVRFALDDISPSQTKIVAVHQSSYHASETHAEI
jgi:hypothetical protein